MLVSLTTSYRSSWCCSLCSCPDPGGMGRVNIQSPHHYHAHNSLVHNSGVGRVNTSYTESEDFHLVCTDNIYYYVNRLPFSSASVYVQMFFSNETPMQVQAGLPCPSYVRMLSPNTY